MKPKKSADSRNKTSTTSRAGKKRPPLHIVGVEYLVRARRIRNGEELYLGHHIFFPRQRSGAARHHSLEAARLAIYVARLSQWGKDFTYRIVHVVVRSRRPLEEL